MILSSLSYGDVAWALFSSVCLTIAGETAAVATSPARLVVEASEGETLFAPAGVQSASTEVSITAGSEVALISL